MVPNSSVSHLRNDPTKIVNISDLFTKNLVWAHIDEIPLNYEILKLVSNATNLQVNKMRNERFYVKSGFKRHFNSEFESTKS